MMEISILAPTRQIKRMVMEGMFGPMAVSSKVVFPMTSSTIDII